MALRNGLLVHGPRYWAAAVRSDGEVLIASGRKPRFAVGPIGSRPLERGVARLAESLAVLPAVRRGLPEARFAMEDGPSNVAILASTLLAAGARYRFRSVLAQEAVATTVGLLPTLVVLRTSPASVWHAVEHKSIAAYEAGGLDEVSHAADHAKEHPRCGSNLVLPLMLTTILANTALRLSGRRRSFRLRAAATAISLGAAVEIFVFAGRSPRHPVGRVVHGAGHAIQAAFVTREPGQDDLDVGRAAMERLLSVESEGS